MSRIVIPLAEIAGGAASRARVQADETGGMIAAFGQRLAATGKAMETDRLDRDLARARIDIQRGLGEAALEMESLGDPDQLDAAWVARSSALRADLTGQADPKNRARVELAFDELSGRHALALGGRALDLRQSQRRATLDEHAYAYIGAAPGLDDETRGAAYDQLVDSVTEAIASGVLSPEEGGDRLRRARDGGERAVVTGLIDTDPDGLLAALDGGAHGGLDPIYREGLRSTARAKIAQREAAAEREAERLEAERVRAVGEQLRDVRDVAALGRVSALEPALMADPAVRSHPGYAEAAAALNLRDVMPEFATLPRADRRALMATEAAKTITAPWQNNQLAAMRQADTAVEQAWTVDPMAQAAAIGFTVPPLADPGQDPGGFARTLAARRGIAQHLVDEGYVARPTFFSPAEREGLKAATAPGVDPGQRATLAHAFVAAFGGDAGAALSEIGGDPVFAHMGALASDGGDRALVAEAFRGQQAIDQKRVALPPAEVIRASGDEVFGDLLAEDPMLEGPILEAAQAIYAARNRGRDPKDFDAAPAFTEAVQIALGRSPDGETGGVQRLRGADTLLPPGVSAAAVETGLGAAAAAMPAVAGADALAPWRAASAGGGLPVFAGQPMTPDLMRQVRLRAVRPGQYEMYVERGGGLFGTATRYPVLDDATGEVYLLDLRRFLDEVAP